MRDTLNGVSRNSIRLRRVILLRSCIRLTPSDIRYASFQANRISLRGEALQYHFPSGKYHSLRQQRIPLLCQQKKREHFRYKTNLFSLFVCYKNLLRRTLLFALLIIRVWAQPKSAFDQSNAMLALSCIFKILR